MKVFVWGDFGQYPECSSGTLVIAEDVFQARVLLRQYVSDYLRDSWNHSGWSSLDEAVEVRMRNEYAGEPDDEYETPVVLEIAGFVYRESL